MYYSERLQGYIKMHQGWCNNQNDRRTNDFNVKLEAWKLNAPVNVSVGKPAGDPPAIPMLLAVDVAKCTERFNQWDEGGEQVFDFYIETPLPVAPDAFQLAPPPPPQPEDPVAGPDGPIQGQYLVSAGDNHPVGSMIQHPQYGKLLKFGYPTPFGAMVVRWIAVR